MKSQQGLRCWLLALSCLLSACATQHEPDRQAARAHAALGAEYLQRNEDQQALQAFRRSLNEDRDNIKANWGAAVANQRLQKNQDADKYYRRALAGHPLPAIHNGYAVFLCQRGNVDEAMAHFEQARDGTASDTQADILANAGLCLYNRNEMERAQAYFRRALARNAEQGVALEYLAHLAYTQSDYLNARAFLERADEVFELTDDQLLLGARIERHLRDGSAVSHYRTRYRAARSKGSQPQNQLKQ